MKGRPNSDLLQDLRWYLEKFLELPLGAYPETAERVQAALKAWGTECFETLFQKQARDWFQGARRHGLKHLTLKIVSDDPGILAWSWEALHDPEGGAPAHDCRLERQLNVLRDPLPLPENLPKTQINILLVIARPYGDADVGYYVVSRPLVALAREPDTPVRIDVLRPPTFDRLRQVLQEHPGLYHIVHFDGHGGYGVPGHTSPHAFKGTRGMLVFEDEQAEPSEVDATLLSSLLAEYRIPIMVLNACQSAKIEKGAEDVFASVAAALLKAGIRSVVAMGYNLFVSGAQQFVPAFYHRLFACGDVAEGRSRRGWAMNTVLQAPTTSWGGSPWSSAILMRRRTGIYGPSTYSHAAAIRPPHARRWSHLSERSVPPTHPCRRRFAADGRRPGSMRSSHWKHWRPTAMKTDERSKKVLTTLAAADPDFAAFAKTYDTGLPPLPPELGDEILAALAEADPRYVAAIGALHDDTAMRSFTGAEAASLVAVVFLLRTHIKVKRGSSGKWEFLVEHKPGDNKLLGMVLDKLEAMLSSSH